MKVRRLKFVWGGARVVQGRWYLGLFGFYSRVEGKREDGLAISGRGLALWSAGLALAAYLGGATTLYYLWQRSTYNVLSYTDALFYPFRRDSISAKKGQAFIAQGTDLWRQKKYHEAASLLRQGLARFPHDFRARMTLSQYYLLLNRRPLGLEVLQQGLTDEYPGRAYLQTLFELAEQGEDYALVAQVSARFRGRLKSESELRDQRWLQTREFGALLAADRKADALALALQGPPSDIANEQRVMALIALGRHEEAIAFLHEWRLKPRPDLALIARLQVRAFREAKQYDAMEQALEEVHRISPALPAPLVYGVVQRAMAGRHEAARKALDDYLFRFGGSPANLQLIAEPLVEIGDLPLLERCAAAAAERGYMAQPYQVMLAQIHLQRGNWAEIGALVPRIVVAKGRDAAISQAWRDWLTRLVDAASAPVDAAQQALVEYFRSRPWPIKLYRKTIEALRRAGRQETAREISLLGAAAFPASAWMRQQLTEIEGELTARQAAIAAATSGAAPTRRQWVEKPFFNQLEALLEKKSWKEADELIGQLREVRPQPAWVASRDADLRLAQVKIGYGNGQTREMLASARLYLNGDTARSVKLLEFARAFHAEGGKAAAIELVREVRRKSPDFAPAQRLLAEWQPAARKQ